MKPKKKFSGEFPRSSAALFMAGYADGAQAKGLKDERETEKQKANFKKFMKKLNRRKIGFRGADLRFQSDNGRPRGRSSVCAFCFCPFFIDF